MSGMAARAVLRRTLAAALLSAGMLVTTSAGIAAAQPEPEPPDEIDCNPFSILCGLQVGPNSIEILPGGSVFPPPPAG